MACRVVQSFHSSRTKRNGGGSTPIAASSSWRIRICSDGGPTRERSCRRRIYDRFDGAQPNAPYFNSVAYSPDGRVWFANGQVVQMVDPSTLSRKALPAPTYIESVTVDRRQFQASGNLGLAPHPRDLQIDYTSPTFTAPQKVKFRYRLDPYDSDWHDAGTRRQAFYTDLPPGNYTFRVVAANSDGVWNEIPTTLEFSIAPAYLQTDWFRALCAAPCPGICGCGTACVCGACSGGSNDTGGACGRADAHRARPARHAAAELPGTACCAFRRVRELLPNAPGRGRRRSWRAQSIRRPRRSPREGMPCRGCAPRPSSATTWLQPSQTFGEELARPGKRCQSCWTVGGCRGHSADPAPDRARRDLPHRQ